ncbi:hypothetical protein Hamer_G013625, partial [Homarus americanus]
IFLINSNSIPIQFIIDPMSGHGYSRLHYAANSEMTCLAKATRCLPDWTSTTRCEIQGILEAINFLLDEEWSGLVIRSCETNPTLPHRAKTDGVLIHFIWISSHIGLHKHDFVDNLAKSACTLPIPDDASTITTGRVKTLLKKAALQNEEQSEQRGVSVLHYDKHATQNVNTAGINV